MVELRDGEVHEIDVTGEVEAIVTSRLDPDHIAVIDERPFSYRMDTKIRREFDGGPPTFGGWDALNLDGDLALEARVLAGHGDLGRIEGPLLASRSGNVNPDWPHCAHVFWPHLVSVVGG